MWQQDQNTPIDDTVIITDIDEAHPGGSQLPQMLRKPRRLVHLVEGMLAVALALGLIIVWFLPGLHSSSTTPRIGTILFTHHDKTVVYDPLWSHDSKQMAFVDQNGAVYVWNSVRGKLTNMFDLPPLYAGSNQIGEWTWAPDNMHLLFATGDGKLRIWNVFTGHLDLTYDTHSNNWPTWSWSLDGRDIAISGKTGTVQIWDVSTGQELATLPSQHVQVSGVLEFSPDRRYIALVFRDEVAEVWDIATGTKLQSLYTPRDPSQAVQQCCNEDVYIMWAPDSKRLAYVRDVGTGKGSVIVVWNALTGRKLLTFSGHTRGVYTVQWSPDGTRIMSAGANEILVWNTTTGQTILNTPGSGLAPGGIPVLSPDGKLLEISDGIVTVEIWDALTGHKIFTYRVVQKTFLARGVEWSPNSKSIALANTDGSVLLWDTTTGQFTYKYSLTSHSIQALVWSPDGKMIGVTSDDGTVAVLQGPWQDKPSARYHIGPSLTAYFD